MVAVLLGILLVIATIGGGWWLFQLGLQQGMSQAVLTREGEIAAVAGAVSTGDAGAAVPATASKVDPSDWGIPEGEQATRRHMSVGLKAGDIDPETGLRILYYHDPHGARKELRGTF